MQYNLPQKTSFFKASYSKQKKEKIKETFYNALFIFLIILIFILVIGFIIFFLKITDYCKKTFQMSHNEICSLYGFILISIFFVFYSIKKGKKILIYIKSIKKQRYLPLTIQDLTHNHIQSEAEFWKLLTSLLQANGEIHPIINEKSYDITMNTYITFFHKTKTEFDKGYKKIFSSQL